MRVKLTFEGMKQLPTPLFRLLAVAFLSWWACGLLNAQEVERDLQFVPVETPEEGVPSLRRGGGGRLRVPKLLCFDLGGLVSVVYLLVLFCCLSFLFFWSKQHQLHQKPVDLAPES